MKIFESIAEARAALAGTTAGDRTLEAIALAGSLPAGITYSVGDSLTWRTVGPECSEDVLVRHRRYLRVVACRTGRVRIDALVGGTPAGEYSDLSDRQLIRDPADGDAAVAVSSCELSPGQIACFAIDEATRLRPSADFSGVLLRVTVEGRSFHNK